MAARSLVALNFAAAAENKIHDDETARRFGFRGGLVPGVAVATYVVPAVLDDLGEGWLDDGVLDVRFESPVYDGDTIEASCSAGVVRVQNQAGDDCCRGTAERVRAGIVDRRPRAAPAPAERPAASRETLAVGTALATITHRADAEAMAAYLRASGDDPAWWVERGLAHPGWLLLDANSVLVASVVLGPWIHVGSRLRLLGRVPLGAELETRAEVLEGTERRGHELVVLDVLTLADGRPAMRTLHTAIWRPRQAATAP